jgi:hypothetical protein
MAWRIASVAAFRNINLGGILKSKLIVFSGLSVLLCNTQRQCFMFVAFLLFRFREVFGGLSGGPCLLLYDDRSEDYGDEVYGDAFQNIGAPQQMGMRPKIVFPHVWNTSIRGYTPTYTPMWGYRYMFFTSIEPRSSRCAENLKLEIQTYVCLKVFCKIIENLGNPAYGDASPNIGVPQSIRDTSPCGGGRLPSKKMLSPPPSTFPTP